MVYAVLAHSHFSEHILEIPHCVSVTEWSSIDSAKEQWGIKLADPVIGHIPMQNLSQVQRHWDNSFLLSLAFGDSDNQVVKVHSGNLKIQGFIYANPCVYESANQSIDSVIISARRLVRENLVNLRIIEDSQLLFLFRKFSQLERLSIAEGLRAVIVFL